MVVRRVRAGVVTAATATVVGLTAGCGATVTVSGPDTTVGTDSPQTPAQIAAARLTTQLLPPSAAPGYAYAQRWSSAQLPNDLPRPPRVTGAAACSALYTSFLRATALGQAASAYAAETITDRKSGDSLTEWIGTFDDTSVARVMSQLPADINSCDSMTATAGDGSRQTLTVRLVFSDETPVFGQSTVAATLTGTGVNLVEVVGRFGDTIASYTVSEPELADAEVAARGFGPVVAARVHD